MNEYKLAVVTVVLIVLAVMVYVVLPFIVANVGPVVDKLQSI